MVQMYVLEFLCSKSFAILPGWQSVCRRAWRMAKPGKIEISIPMLVVAIHEAYSLLAFQSKQHH